MTARFRLNGFFASGPSYKVGLMLSLVGEPFDYHSVNLMAGEHRQPEYLALNRYGQVPCLEDLENGRRLVQSAAILEYIADRTGRFGGATYDERLTAREWLFWDFDRLAPMIYRLRLLKIGFYKAHEAIAADLEERAGTALAVLEKHLSGRDWMVGEGPTFADVDIYGVLAFAGEAGIDLATRPAIAAFLARMERLPGWAHREGLLPRTDRAA